MNRDKKEILKKIFLEFNPETIALIRRDLTVPFNSSLIVSIIGPRKAGKTYFLYQLIQNLLKKGVNKNQIIYINFEDERLLPFKKEELDFILEAYFELNPNQNKKIFFFFDEIQNIPFWPQYLRRLTEKNHSIFITGSSSKLLSFEIATTLRGRTLPFFINPFSFEEFLRYKKIILEKNFSYQHQRFRIKKLFNEFFKFGGLPQIFDFSDDLKLRYLQEYINLVIYKDILERYQIKNINFFKEFTRNLILETGNLFSLTAYFKALKNLGLSFSKNTLFQYLSYLEEINLIFMSPIFSKSKKSQVVNPRKIYSFDTGLYTALSFEEEKGKLLETLVFLGFKRKGYQLFYFRKEKEVDIIAKQGEKIIPIQVCYSLKNQKTKEREINGLIEFNEIFKVKEGYILTADETGRIKEKRLTINILPVWKFLLDTSTLES